MYVEKIPWTANYEETEIPAYTLPDALLCQDGTTVKNAEEWQNKRRPELLEIFKKEMYGQILPMPDHVEYEVLTDSKPALDGIAMMRQTRIHFKMDNGKSHDVDVLMFTPAKEGKHPVFVGLTFVGNHVCSTDPEIIITGRRMDASEEYQKDLESKRGFQERRFPLKEIISRGYAIAFACYHDIFPDRPSGWKESALNLFIPIGELATPSGYSSIGVWSWGISRILDYVSTLPEIDAEKACVFGHSRLGKTSLWTGVIDERFKLVCVNDSGCGGAALSRRLYGETLFSMMHYTGIGKYWFTATLRPYVYATDTLPMDQHELIALVAPRAVAVHSATEDQWADPTGEYLSAYYAGKVFSLFGKEPLKSLTPPPPDTPVGTDVSYFERTGKHDILVSDWTHYMDMADRIFKK